MTSAFRTRRGDRRRSCAAATTSRCCRHASRSSTDHSCSVACRRTGAATARARGKWCDEFRGSNGRHRCDDAPLPPLAQQRAIADYLDRETARLDALVAAKERVLGLLAEKRRALITRAVTRGLDPRAPLRDSGIPWLGEIPAHWQILQLKFVTRSLHTGPFGSQLHAEEYITGGVPVVNPSHLSSGRICADDRVSVDEATAERLVIHRLSPCDVVFARRGELGRCGVVEPSQAGWLCGTGSLRARLRLDMVDPYYIVLVFTGTRVSDVLTFESVGSTMDNLNTEILGSCQFGVPPLTEQRAIVAHITAETAKLDALHAATERTIAILRERRAALIAAAVTGRMIIHESPGDDLPGGRVVPGQANESLSYQKETEWPS